MQSNAFIEDENLLNIINENDDMIDKFIDAHTKLASCLVDIPNAILDPVHDQDIDKLRIAFKDLRTSILLIFEQLMDRKKKDADRIADLETRFGEIHLKWKNEEKKVEEAETRIVQLTNQITKQSNFCTSLGAVLGNFLWTSSKFPQMTNIWLSGNQTKMGEFVSIVSTTFISFINTFKTNFPPLNNDECQFIMAQMGTIANISSTPLGRQFLTNHEAGIILIKQLIESLPTIPKDTGDPLKRLMLMVLYNISLNRVGLPLLLNSNIDKNIGLCLIDESIAIDVQVAALRLLQSLTYNLTDPYILQRIIDSIPINRIELLATSMNNTHKISKIAQEVINNIINSQANADTVSQVTSSTDNN